MITAKEAKQLSENAVKPTDERGCVYLEIERRAIEGQTFLRWIGSTISEETKDELKEQGFEVKEYVGRNSSFLEIMWR